MLLLNGDPVNVTLFPDHTSQVWKLDEKHFNQERATISWEFSHEGEIMHLAQLKMLLDCHIDSLVDHVSLEINFLPYGRQDKFIDNDATFALRTFATQINSMHFNEISILDPHSETASSLFNSKTVAVFPHRQLTHAILETDSNMICYPDKGAVTKYVGVYKTDLPYIYGEKARDQSTGYISNYKLIGNCRDNKVLIVDDICDGGKTFEILAKDLLIRGAKEINLFITHGLFTKGLRPLKNAGINRIFTAKGEAIKMPDGGFGFRCVENTGLEIHNGL